jgi:hypothetical protein
VNDLSNRIVKVEKMLQNQLVISQPKPINQRRPYQYPKKNEEPKPPTQAPGTNYIDYASSSFIVELVTFLIVNPHALSLPKHHMFMSRERIHLVTQITL